ncbi:MAG: methylated-DNA--[protein]-cysteine S-methyltransferase, partial [Natrialbaceae archaeon]
MEDAGIYARESTFLDRYVQIGVAQGRVLSVDFPTEPDAGAGTEHELLDRIEAYLGGESDDFSDVTVALTLPTAKGEVLEKVREIPYGDSGTVEQVTMMVPGRSPDDESDLAAVREGLAANPAPILIPDHRVRDAPSA